MQHRRAPQWRDCSTFLD